MELEVKGCNDCPMFISADFSPVFECGAEKKDLDQDKYFQPVTPSWCPLKIEPIIITLKN